MSLLKEVMSLCNEKEKEECQQQLESLQPKVLALQKKIIEVLDRTYLKLISKPFKIDAFKGELISMKEILQNLGKIISKNLQSREIFIGICETLNELLTLYEIHDCLLDTDMHFFSHNYEDTLKSLRNIQNIMVESKYQSVLGYFTKSFSFKYSQMSLRFGELLSRKFVLNIEERMYSFRVNRYSEVDKLIVAIIRYGYIDEISFLLNFIKMYLFIPIVTTYVHINCTENELFIFQVTEDQATQNTDIVKHSVKLCNFLRNVLLLECDGDKSSILLKFIGNKLNDDLLELYVNHFEKFMEHNENENLDCEMLVERATIIDSALLKIGISLGKKLIESIEKLMKNYQTGRNHEIYMNASKSLLKNKNIGFETTTLMDNFDRNSVDLVISNKARNFMKIVEKMSDEMEIETHRNKILNDMLCYYRSYIWGKSKEYSGAEAALFSNDFKYISYGIKKSHLIQKDEMFGYQKELFELISEQILTNFIQVEENKIRGLFSRIESIGFRREVLANFLNRMKCLKEIFDEFLTPEKHRRITGNLFDICFSSLLKLLRSESTHKKSVTTVLELVLKNIFYYFPDNTNLKECIPSYEFIEQFLH